MPPGPKTRLKAFRFLAPLLPQLLLALVVGGRFELLSDFPGSDAGLGVLLGLLVLAPLATLVWLLIETAVALVGLRYGQRTGGWRWTGWAGLFFVQALVLDFYILSQMKM